jgi:hypothetical protein
MKCLLRIWCSERESDIFWCFWVGEMGIGVWVDENLRRFSLELVVHAFILVAFAFRLLNIDTFLDG